MTKEEQQKHFEDRVEKMRKIMLSKGNDYSTADRLANFKQVGAIMNMHPAKVALVLACVKISRMSNLLDQGRLPENEALEDTSIDLTIYTMLADSCLKEKPNE